MTVTKEHILLFLLDRLDNKSQDEVAKALREDADLHAFYCARLHDFEELGLVDLLVEDEGQYDADENDLEDDEIDDPIVLVGDEQFDRYAHLPAEEAVRRFVLDQVEKRIEVLKSQPNKLVASYLNRTPSVAACDSLSAPRQNQSDSASDELFWSNGETDQILLTLLSATDRSSVRMRVTFTVMPNDSKTLAGYATVEPITFESDPQNPRLWRGILPLKDYNLATGQGTITKLEGQYDA
jgi:hypothetical protein